jgi:hypothetical protein
MGFSFQFHPPYSNEIENCVTQHRSIVIMIKTMPKLCSKLLNIRNVTDNAEIVGIAVYLVTASNVKCQFLGTLVYFYKNIPVS